MDEWRGNDEVGKGWVGLGRLAVGKVEWNANNAQWMIITRTCTVGYGVMGWWYIR